MQEHIALLLKPSIPESWEREIRSAYTDPWGDSPEIKDDDKDGKELQGAPDSFAGSNVRWRKSPEGSLEESSNHASQSEDDHDVLGSEEDDESSRSDDTRHSSDSEGEYR